MKALKKQNKREDLQLVDSGGDYLLRERVTPQKWLGVFYAPAGGCEHRVARMVTRGVKFRDVDMFYVGDVEVSRVLDYQNLVFIFSSLKERTWEQEKRDPWIRFFSAMRHFSLRGRKVALIGLSDSMEDSYSWIDVMADSVEQFGGQVVGQRLNDDHERVGSLNMACRRFRGLLLDEVYESGKTDLLIDNWLMSVLEKFRDIEEE